MRPFWVPLIADPPRGVCCVSRLPGVEDMGKFISAVAIAVSLAGIGSASAQPYPLRPITLGIAFAAGGPGDTLARILAERSGGAFEARRSGSRVVPARSADA